MPTRNALRISMVHVEVPVTPPPHEQRGSRSTRQLVDTAPPRNVVSLDIRDANCQVWDEATYTVGGEWFKFNDSSLLNRGSSMRPVTEIPYFPTVFRFLAEQYFANQGNPVGAFIRNAVVAMETQLAEKDGFSVYFAKADNRVKIGWSKRVASRIAQLQVGNASSLELLGVIPGGRVTERQIHARFAHARRAGEWFEATPELLAYVSATVAEQERRHG